MSDQEQTDEQETEEPKGDDGKKINDPLTRSDVEAPQVPFGGED